jgi:hypothetical protein
MSYKSEFGESFHIPARVRDAIKRYGMQDESWHNDVCPSFSKDLGSGIRVVLWCDWASPALREFNGERFAVVLASEDNSEQEPLFSCERVQSLLDWLEGAL